MRNIIIILSLFGVFALTACEQNLINPNAASDQEVLNTRDGMIALSVGLRQAYSSRVLSAVIGFPSVTSREAKGVTTDLYVFEIENGGAGLPISNGYVLEYWSALQAQLGMCESVLRNAPNVADLDPGMLSGIMAQAYLIKGMSLTNLATAFQEANLNSDENQPVKFLDRKTVLDAAVKMIDSAVMQIESVAPSSSFKTMVTGPNFDLVNSVYAMGARINLIAGNYADALAFTNKVDLNKTSQFNYSTLTPNPLYQRFNISRTFLPRVHFGLPDSLYDPADQRLNFYFSGNVQTINNDQVTNLAGFGASQTTAIPVYTPDEVRLIKAETILRTNGNPNDALALINFVRTQTAGDPFGVNAGLSSYSGLTDPGSLLNEVYRQRCAELYMSGLKWEDTRRFNRPAPPTFMSERNRIFYPYPELERISNPNTPNDPSI